MKLRWLWSGALTLVAVACSVDRLPTRPPGGSLRISHSPAHAISDAVHGGGTPHFYFLPPMVPQPGFAGLFDSTINSVVEVCEWTDGCANVVARFTMQSGTGGQVVRTDPAAGQYIVNWNTQQCVSGPCVLDVTKTYRIEVLALSTVLAFADVELVANGSQLKNLNTGEYIGLVDGRTLPIKFRIEQGAVAIVGTGGGAATLDDGAVVIAFPDGALVAPIAVTAAPIAVGADSTDTSILPGTLYQFAPSPTTFASEASLELSYPQTLPLGTHADRLALCKMLGGACRPLAGSTVNLTSHSVAGRIGGFSQYGVSEWPEILRGVFNGFGEPQSVQLYTDSGEVVVLSKIASDIDGPLQWLQGGNRVVYIGSDDNGRNESLRTVNVDGSGITTLVETGQINGAMLAPSPDGSSVLYAKTEWTDSAHTDYHVGLMMVPSVGGMRQRLVTVNPAVETPAWSPDGRRIAFEGECGGGAMMDLCVINSDGTGLQQLVMVGGAVRSVAWSPDGARIAFALLDLPPTCALNVINVDGTGLRCLVPGNGYVGVPHIAWSPTDVNVLLFEKYDDLASENCGCEFRTIQTIRSDGSSEVVLSPDSVASWSPTWSPDGRRVAFTSLIPNSTYGVWLVNADGTGLQRLDSLVDGLPPYGVPHWRP